MNRIKELREARGLTQQQVADMIPLHLTNYNRLENGKTAISKKNAAALSRIFNCSPSELVSNMRNVRMVKIRQHVQAGAWSESCIWPEDEWYEVAVPDEAQWSQLSLFGAETKGPSMNRRYPDGSALVYTSIFETHEEPVPGRRYIVETIRPDGLCESTVKTLWQDEAGKYWLLPDSDDPRYQAPIPVEGDHEHEIRIVGRVVFSVTREP